MKSRLWGSDVVQMWRNLQIERRSLMKLSVQDSMVLHNAETREPTRAGSSSGSAGLGSAGQRVHSLRLRGTGDSAGSGFRVWG